MGKPCGEFKDTDSTDAEGDQHGVVALLAGFQTSMLIIWTTWLAIPSGKRLIECLL